MRTERYRPTRYDKASAKGSTYQLPSKGRYELYDYAADPGENVNIAADPKHRELLEKLIAQMDSGWKAAAKSNRKASTNKK